MRTAQYQRARVVKRDITNHARGNEKDIAPSPCRRGVKHDADIMRLFYFLLGMLQVSQVIYVLFCDM